MGCLLLAILPTTSVLAFFFGKFRSPASDVTEYAIGSAQFKRCKKELGSFDPQGGVSTSANQYPVYLGWHFANEYCHDQWIVHERQLRSKYRMMGPNARVYQTLWVFADRFIRIGEEFLLNYDRDKEGNVLDRITDPLHDPYK